MAERAAEQKAASAASFISGETATAPRDAAHPLAGAYAVWLPVAKLLTPHFHLIIWGEEPRTAFRCMPFSGDMPEELLALLPSTDS